MLSLNYHTVELLCDTQNTSSSSKLANGQIELWPNIKLRFLNVFFNHYEWSNRGLIWHGHWKIALKAAAKNLSTMPWNQLHNCVSIVLWTDDTRGLWAKMMMSLPLILSVLYVKAAVFLDLVNTRRAAAAWVVLWEDTLIGLTRSENYSKHCDITGHIKALTGTNFTLKPDSKLQYFRMFLSFLLTGKHIFFQTSSLLKLKNVLINRIKSTPIKFV